MLKLPSIYPSGAMTSTFVPVETILKVDESELLVGDVQKNEIIIPASTSYVSIGTQCDWKVESSDEKICNLLPVTDSDGTKCDLINPANMSFGERNEELPLLIRGWPAQCDQTISSEQKFIIPATFSQQFACNIQGLPFDEKFFLQFDYKTRNKLKTKQRRLDPYYRSQERVRQRTVMRLKRQDPRFRAAEREKGRYRMRLKRLDPVFRSQERERQRERMKLKRSNPDFREREREQQKNRLHIKRMDPAFKEKERVQDLLRMQIRQQTDDIYSSSDDSKLKDSKSENSVITDQSVFKEVDETGSASELRNNQLMFHEGFNAKLLSVKTREPNLETFHFKKQHILNFNFYNSSKEQWATPDDATTKNMNHFNIDENAKLEVNDVAENSLIILDKSKFIQSKKTFSKHELISENLMNSKLEIPQVLEMERVKDSLNSDPTSIPPFSLSPSTEN